MNLSIAALLCGACALACATQASPPPTAAAAPAAPPAPTRVETAQVAESAPPEQGIPKNAPPLAPPAPPVAPPPDQTPLTLTPAAGVGAPRTSSASLVSDSTRDKPETAQDQESIREIRELLAQDRSLAAIAHQVTIVAKQGRVSLRGQVNTAGQRAAIEKAARQAVGVINVKNELAVME